MNQDLEELIIAVRGYTGVKRKLPIRQIVEKLRPSCAYGNPLPNYGDDAAVIPHGDEFLLLAADGMMTGLLIAEPYAAGKASVMVTVNDIYSMGGRPMAMVNVLASGPEKQRGLIVDGIAKGCAKLRVPMVGGHLHPDAPEMEPALSVAILGRAKKILRSHLAAEGDDIIVAVDFSGRAGCRTVVSWDANSGKTPDQLLHRLEALPCIAENELSVAAKDISNAGLLGTTAIMMENSGKGADIDINAIPLPPDMALRQWVMCFQSYGFVLAVNSVDTPKVIKTFTDRNVTAAVIGRVTDTSLVTLIDGNDRMDLFDFNTDEITGIRYNGAV